jgi:hypothetical protein
MIRIACVNIKELLLVSLDGMKVRKGNPSGKFLKEGSLKHLTCVAEGGGGKGKLIRTSSFYSRPMNLSARIHYASSLSVLAALIQCL